MNQIVGSMQGTDSLSVYHYLHIRNKAPLFFLTVPGMRMAVGNIEPNRDCQLTDMMRNAFPYDKESLHNFNTTRLALILFQQFEQSSLTSSVYSPNFL